MAERAGPDAAAIAPREPGRVREFWPAVLCTLLILYCASPGAGFLLPLWLAIVLAWCVRLGWIAWRRPARRQAQGVKLLMLVVAMTVAALAHGRYESQSRAQAQKVVDAVTAYHVQHGGYPDDLRQVGLDEQALRRDWQVRYLNRDGQHRVVYAAEFTVYDSYAYDFDKPGWVYSAD